MFSKFFTILFAFYYFVPIIAQDSLQERMIDRSRLRDIVIREYIFPERLNSRGDTLYAIYRKGLITRHIAKNGRLLTDLNLEKSTLENYDPSSKTINVTHSDGHISKIPIEHARYTQEIIPGDWPNYKPYLWVPVLAPIKNPGYRNDGYYVISSQGDNPLYLGGMALATLSLEHKYGVSSHSIKYARKLVEYFIASEMWPGSGYMIRRAKFFNSGRNKNGEPIIQGASSEELLGVMLGLMFYLKAESPSHPLFSAASSLRDRILREVSRGEKWASYKHPFMISNNDASYWVKHFEFPMYASKGVYRPGFLDGIEQTYISTLTLGSGDTRPASANFFDYAMFLTSMTLVLEGDIPENKKEWFAKVFMRDVIKASNTAGPDRDKLNGNAYMGVVAKLVNKYLNSTRDSEVEGNKLHSIWSSADDWLAWGRVKASVDVKIANPQSINNEGMNPTDLSNRLHWQHNLPLRNRLADIGDSMWKNHNPNRRIGSNFVWIGAWPFYWQGESDWGWDRAMPGFINYGDANWETVGGSWNEAEYKTTTAKRYDSEQYVIKELVQSRGSDDNQVEGAGMGLLFLRMLLTHINPVAYPPPNLPSYYNEEFPVLPYPGVEPLSPQMLHYDFQYYSKTDQLSGEYKIKGDTDQTLRIVKLGGELYGGNNFVLAYASDDEKLKLVHGFAVPEELSSFGQTFQKGFYINSLGNLGERFDKVVLARTQGGVSGDEVIVVAERAEDDRSYWCKRHWLRLSLWTTSPPVIGHAPQLRHRNTWEQSEHKDCGSVKLLDMKILGKKYVAVFLRTQNDKDRIRVFEIDFSNYNLTEKLNVQIAGKVYDDSFGITTAFDNVLIYAKQSSNGWTLHSSIFNGETLSDGGSAYIGGGKELLDLTTVKKVDLTAPDLASKYYAIAVITEDGYLQIHSWEVSSDGALIPKGAFFTKDGEDYLVGREADWEMASITNYYKGYESGFVITGKGVARAVRNVDGESKKSAKGLKIIYGYIMDDGRPTIESSNVIGSGDDNAMNMLDVTANMYTDGLSGVVTAHKTKDDYLMLIYWNYKDDRPLYRWGN